MVAISVQVNLDRPRAVLLLHALSMVAGEDGANGASAQPLVVTLDSDRGQDTVTILNLETVDLPARGLESTLNPASLPLALLMDSGASGVNGL